MLLGLVNNRRKIGKMSISQIGGYYTNEYLPQMGCNNNYGTSEEDIPLSFPSSSEETDTSFELTEDKITAQADEPQGTAVSGFEDGDFLDVASNGFRDGDFLDVVSNGFEDGDFLDVVSNGTNGNMMTNPFMNGTDFETFDNLEFAQDDYSQSDLSSVYGSSTSFQPFASQLMEYEDLSSAELTEELPEEETVEEY